MLFIRIIGSILFGSLSINKPISPNHFSFFELKFYFGSAFCSINSLQLLAVNVSICALSTLYTPTVNIRRRQTGGGSLMKSDEPH